MMKSPPKGDSAKPVWTRHISRIALGGALSLIALASVAPSVARAEDGDGGLWGSVLKGLGIGGENNIEYRERPPLVVPPTHDLPPPQTSATARDPNWPVDPSANRQTAEKPKKGNQIRDLDRITVAPRPAEPGMAGSGAPNPYPGGDTAAALPPPSQPAASGGFFGNLFSSSDRPAGPIITPSRKSLTEPPSDFESPSPSQPYGAPPPKPDPAKKVTPESAATASPAGSSGPGSSGL